MDLDFGSDATMKESGSEQATNRCPNSKSICNDCRFRGGAKVCEFIEMTFATHLAVVTRQCDEIHSRCSAACDAVRLHLTLGEAVAVLQVMSYL